MPTITGFSVPVGCALITGGAIGELQVPGNIQPGDALLAVQHVEDGTPPTATDITAECSISATKGGVIETTVTNTTGDHVHVLWAKSE
ncbi:hypothetical protein [uncultured Maricaulis sp.]|uniref:hypothetical protein n=1 Tax=uncultured Maricaulis sp. TaxID=174710 RepID=UPI0030D9AC75|tara:strand:- start:134981 stop:135244 length:264 start_codon:yes stop_codon:yes gene_type:complete